MKNKKYILMAIIAIVLIIVVFKMINSIAAKKSSVSKNNDLGIPIEIESVLKGNMIEELNYVGTVEPNKSATISPTIAGQVVRVFIEEGSVVKRGDILIKIDDSQLVASLETTTKKLETLKTNFNYLSDEINKFYETSPLITQLQSAQTNYDYLKTEKENYKGLFEEGAIPKTTYDKIEQETNSAFLKTEELKAMINNTYDTMVHEKNIAQKQIDEFNSLINELNVKIEDTIIKAPISGVVRMRSVDVGDLAVVGKPVVTIDDIEEFIIKVNISENDIKKISVNSKATIKTNELNYEKETVVNKIIPNVNPNTRIGLIELGPIKNENITSFYSGNSVEVKINVNEAKNKLIIPKKSIKSLNNKDIVYLYNDGIVNEIEITTGIAVGENVEVKAGLKEGDLVAANNLSKLYENALVYVFKGDEQ